MDRESSSSRTFGWMRGTLVISKPIVALFLVLMTGLFVIDGLLLVAHKNLNSALRMRDAAMAPKAGEIVPPLGGVDVNGNPLNIDYPRSSNTKTLLFVFSTECRICDLSWPRWQEVAAAVDTSRYRLVYVNLSSSLTAQYRQTHRLMQATIIARPAPDTVIAYNLRLTPTVLLVDSNARITNVWLGAKEDGFRDMARTLNIPGFSSPHSELPLAQ